MATGPPARPARPDAHEAGLEVGLQDLARAQSLLARALLDAEGPPLHAGRGARQQQTRWKQSKSAQDENQCAFAARQKGRRSKKVSKQLRIHWRGRGQSPGLRCTARRTWLQGHQQGPRVHARDDVPQLPSLRAPRTSDMTAPGFLQQIQEKYRLLGNGYRAGTAHAVPGLQASGLLFAGMGGSGAASLLVRDAAGSILERPFTLTHHHAVPHHVKKDWHALAISYSGETEETLDATREVVRRGCRVTAFSTGGTLARLAERCVEQPTGYPPRVALAHVWFSVLGFLEGSGLLSQPVPLGAAQDAVRAIDASCGPTVPEERNEAKQIARSLHERIPQIFTTPSFTGVGTFFASLLNENAKKIADIDEIPECNHNALTGWSGDPNRGHFTVLVLSNRGERPEMARRIAFMQQRYTEWGVPWRQRDFAPTETFAAHVVEQARALQLLDYVSYYTATLRSVDPAEIEAVAGLKAYLRGPDATPPLVRTPALAPLPPLVQPQGRRHVRPAHRF